MVKQTLAFIGLGVMGYPLAGHLATAGYSVRVYNRTESKAEAWCESYQGQHARTVKEVVKDADIVITCVGNDDDIYQLVLGPEGFAGELKPNTLVIDHTTTSAMMARQIGEQLAVLGHGFIDAPVSGGQIGAEKGQLTIMCGGKATHFEKALPVLQTYAVNVKRLGEQGAGQLSKMVNQICVAGLLQGLSEAIHFAKASDLDVMAVIDVIRQGAAQSWQMENRAGTMSDGEYNHGFAVDWMRKDLGYVLDESRRNGSHLPVTALVDQFYSEVQAIGGGRWDTSSLLARLETLHKS